MQSSPEIIIEQSEEREFGYFDAEGNLLGETIGKSPEDDLFGKAHYVIVNQTKMIKNKDSKEQIEADLKACEKALLRTSVSDMNEILYLNRLIKALRAYLSE